MDNKIDRYSNLEMNIADGVLTIRIVVDETKVDAQESKSGKSLVVATSGGAVKVPNSPLRLNLTLYRKL